MTSVRLDLMIQSYLASLIGDCLDILLLEKGLVRLSLLNGTRMVNEMRAKHRLGILETLALGQAYLGASLCTNQLKGQDQLSLNLECSGPLAGFSVECTAAGQIRGYLKVDHIPLAAPLENFELAPFIGEGSLSVTKFLEVSQQSYTGTVQLLHKSIARDLTRYFQISEQTRTAIVLSVFFDKAGVVRGAGGLFLQALPGADEELLADLEDWLNGLPSLGKCLAEGEAPAQFWQKHFRAFQPELIGSRAVEFYCSCQRERFLAYLRHLPESERQALREINPRTIGVRCHNCGSDYRFTYDELK